jgi:anti-sigma B factor antagonist
VVTFTDRAIIDEKTIQTIGEELIRLVEKFGTHQLLLNFGQIENLSSYMLAMLVDLHKKLQARSGRLALCAIHPDVYQVFELTRLTKIFNIYPDQPSAIKSF